jgi:hypothetical protein
MQKSKTLSKLQEVEPPEKTVEVPKPNDPEEPLIPNEDPDINSEEEPFETPPNEVPPPAEGHK